VSWMTRPFVGPEGVSDTMRTPRDIPISPLRKARGKRSVVLDLRNPAGARVLRELVAVSDVLVENFKAGTMDRLGLGWPTLEALNPRLVYASITGYGHDGPYRDKPAMDPIVQAMSGFMAKTGFPDGPPTRAGATIGDQVPGMWAAFGVLAALRQRDLDGRGQMVDVAMLDSMLTLMWDEPLDEYEDRGMPERVGNGDPRGAPFDTFPTSDGWVALAAPANSQWEKLAPYLGGAALDEKWRDHFTRANERAELNELVAAFTQARTTAQCVTALEPAGIPIAAVNPPWWARHDPHVAHRGALEQLRHPDLDEPTRWLGPVLPVRFSRADTSTTPAEPLGESTEAVLRDLLGYDATAIAELRAEGAFG
jgi:CoA:oxalate CoA-transferase